MDINFNDPVQRFSFISLVTGQIIYDYDVLTEETKWYGAIKEITGYTPKVFRRVNITKWSTLIHPDDRDLFLQNLKKLATSNTKHKIRYRIRKKDKTYLYIEDTSVFVYSNRTLTRVFGIIKDITEALKTQKVLDMTERLKSLA